MSNIAATFKVLHEDFRRALKAHRNGCLRCSPDHICAFALGLSGGHRIIASRLSPKYVSLLEEPNDQQG